MVVYDRLRADQAEQLADGKRTALHWIEDDAAWLIIDARREEVRRPLQWLARAARVDPSAEQCSVATGFCLVAFEAGVREPRAAEAKAGISDALARLPAFGCAIAICQLGVLRDALRSMAADMSKAGVRIDPRFDPECSLLAQLCCLDSRDSLDPESLIYTGPNTFSPDGRGTISRSSHVKTRRPESVGRLQRAVLEADPAYQDIRPSSKESGRAGGLKKGSADARREALTRVLESHSLDQSDRSAARVIWESWGRRGAGLAMQQITGEPNPPSVWTLAKDLSKVRNTTT